MRGSLPSFVGNEEINCICSILFQIGSVFPEKVVGFCGSGSAIAVKCKFENIFIHANERDRGYYEKAALEI